MKTKTVIIGGGFAGRQACRQLAGTDTEILLFDPGESTVMLPALPDLAGGWIEAPLLYRPLKELLPKSVRHVQKAVCSVDLDSKTLTADGETFSFDQLLFAAGSTTNFYDLEQYRDHIYQLDSLSSALRIRSDFLIYLRDTEVPHIVVAGGGYTGLELVLSLYYRARSAGKSCRITVVDPAPELLAFLPAEQKAYLNRFFEKIGMVVLNGAHIENVDGNNITAAGQIFEKVFFCLAGGSRFPDIEIKGDVKQFSDGRLKVNPDLSLPGYPDAFAAGDAAAFEQRGNLLRKGVNSALYGGRRAGINIARRRKGLETRSFRPVDLGWVIPLHETSVGKLFDRFWIQGKIGLRLHYFMCGFQNYAIVNFLGFAKIATKRFNKGGGL